MATFEKVLLSGSTQGKAIKVAATTSGSAGTTIHATGTSSSIIDPLCFWQDRRFPKFVPVFYLR